MGVLVTILKVSVIMVLVASLIEALVLSVRNGWPSYDWKAAGVSVFDFLVREYPLRWLLPLAFWTDAMGWFWQHRLWTLPMDHWSGWVACFVGQEFFYYWYHRAAHRVRWFWCTHAIHHSSNQLNLSAAYRFGWTNLEYLDGNYGGVLIIFDRLFGTYIAERPDTPCRYGLVRPMTSYNVLIVEFDHWRALWRDLRTATSAREVVGYLLKPPGWRPDGLGQTTADLRRHAKVGSDSTFPAALPHAIRSP